MSLANGSGANLEVDPRIENSERAAQQHSSAFSSRKPSWYCTTCRLDIQNDDECSRCRTRFLDLAKSRPSKEREWQRQAREQESVAAKKDAVHAPDTASLLNRILAIFNRFIVFKNEHQPVALSLFVLHTWAFDAAERTPYIHISSPSKQCGKSQLLDLLGYLVRSPMLSADMSDAALYRAIQANKPTLLLDEVDALFGRDAKVTAGLRGLLNAGFQPGRPVYRMMGQRGDQFGEFEVFCPKVLAGIRGIPDTVADRSIRIDLVRKKPSENVAPMRARKVEAETRPLRDECEAWAASAATGLADVRPEAIEELSDRANDIWEPLLAIAEQASPRWLDTARKAAAALSSPGSDDGSTDGDLLRDIRAVFEARPDDRITSKDLLEALIECEGSPWAAWWGRDVSAGQHKGPASRLAKILKPYGPKPKKIRFGDRTDQGYARSDFEDAWSRFIPSEKSEHRNMPGGSPIDEDPGSEHGPPLTSDVPMFHHSAGGDRFEGEL